MKLAAASLIACVLLNVESEAYTLRRQAGGISLYAHKQDQCIIKGSPVAWGNCKDAIVFQKPANAKNTRLVTLDGKRCLGTARKSDNTAGITLTSCKPGAGTNSEKWAFISSKQLKTLGPWQTCLTDDDESVATACPNWQSKITPTCLSMDIDIPFLVDCSKMKVEVVANPSTGGNSGSGGGATTSNKFEKDIIAASKLKFPNIIGIYPFKVVNGKNDVVEKYKTGTPFKTMVEKCYAACINFDCLAFEVVGNKYLCNLALNSAGTDDLKADPSAITFFRKPT